MQNKPNPQQSDSKLHFLDYWRIIRIRKTVILAVFLLVVLTTALVTYILKPTYSSSVRIAIEKDSADITPLIGMQMSQQHDPYWVLTEFEKIQSKVVLHPVIESLELRNKWMERYNLKQPLSLTEAFDVLKKTIEVDQYRNTSLIEITAYSQDKDEAASIAQEIAEQYKSVRESNLKSMANAGIDALKAQYADQNEKVKLKQAELDALREELNISDIYSAEGSSIGMTTEPQIVLRLEQERTVAEAKLIRFHTLFNELEAMTLEQLKNTILTAMPGNLRLTSLLNEYDKARQSFAQLKAIHGQEHPQMKSIAQLLGEIEVQVTSEITGVLRGLQSQVNAAQNELNELTSEDADERRISGKATQKDREESRATGKGSRSE
jgi:succinoglycan biosynthesis transport protein ExoP